MPTAHPAENALPERKGVPRVQYPLERSRFLELWIKVITYGMIRLIVFIYLTLLSTIWSLVMKPWLSNITESPFA